MADRSTRLLAPLRAIRTRIHRETEDLVREHERLSAEIRARQELTSELSALEQSLIEAGVVGLDGPETHRPCPVCGQHRGPGCECIPEWFWRERHVQAALRNECAADLVRLLRRKLDLRQVIVAHLTAGVAQSTVSRVETGAGLSRTRAARVWDTLCPPRAAWL